MRKKMDKNAVKIILVLAVLATLSVCSVAETMNQGFGCSIMDLRPLQNRLAASCGGTTPLIYVWQRDGDMDGVSDAMDFALGIDTDVGYGPFLDLGTIPSGSLIFLKVSDNRTDTQILKFELIASSIGSIGSLLETDCGYITPQSGAYGYKEYSILYTPGFGKLRDLQYYRLYDKDTVWVKILGITPYLKDTRYGEGWTRTSPPDNTNISIYVIAGAKRRQATPLIDLLLNPTPLLNPITLNDVAFAAYLSSAPLFDFWLPFNIPYYEYREPLTDRLYLTIAWGTGPTQRIQTSIQNIWSADTNVEVRSLLPFPPADSIGDPFNPPLTTGPDYVIHNHIYEGWRYSFFIWNFSLPDDATVLDILANYEINATITDVNNNCVIRDSSTVGAKFFVNNHRVSNSTLGELTIPQGGWLNVSGYYDVITNPLTGEDMVTGGYVYVNMSPDELAGVMLDVNAGTSDSLPASVYTHLQYPARHVLYGKEKPLGSSSRIMREYYADDDYGYYSTDFAFDGRCKRPICGSGCTCPPWDIFDATCTDYSDPANPIQYKPNEDFNVSNNCRCLSTADCTPDKCTPPAASSRTYHEFEQTYFDFAEFYTRTLTPPDDNIMTYPDTANDKRIRIDHIIEKVYGRWKPQPADGQLCYCTLEGQNGQKVWDDVYFIDYVPYEVWVVGNNPATCGNLVIGYTSCWMNQPPTFITDAYDLGFFTDGGVDVTFNNGAGCHIHVVPDSVACIGNNGWSGRVELTNCAILGTNYVHVEGDDHGDLGLNGCIIIKYGKTKQQEKVEELYFSAAGISEAEFAANGKVTVFTHFRNKTFQMSSELFRRHCTEISWDVSSSGGYSRHSTGVPPESGELRRGDVITVDFTLEDCTSGGTVAGEDVNITVSNYQNRLSGVWQHNGNSYITTDGSGNGRFSFVMGYDPAVVAMRYSGNYTAEKTVGGVTTPASGYMPSQASFMLGISQVSSPFTSVDFFLLLAIGFLLLFFWRWFRKGRLDLYSMWQELKGEEE